MEGMGLSQYGNIMKGMDLSQYIDQPMSSRFAEVAGIFPQGDKWCFTLCDKDRRRKACFADSEDAAFFYYKFTGIRDYMDFGDPMFI